MSKTTVSDASGSGGTSVMTLPLQSHGRAVREDFGAAGCELGRVVAEGNHGVGPALLGMPHHPIVRLAACRFTDLGVRLNVATDDLLEGAEQVLADAGRAHDDAAHDAELIGNHATAKVI